MRLNFPHVTDIPTGFGRLVPEISLPQLIGSTIDRREDYVRKYSGHPSPPDPDSHGDSSIMMEGYSIEDLMQIINLYCNHLMTRYGPLRNQVGRWSSY